jgi:CelD/BcsL family acetyltransferase involved in cellulose biosynthesis
MSLITETVRAVHLRTYTSFEEAAEIAPEWDALVRELDGSLYMTYDWLRVWWNHYGHGRELRLIAVRDGDELAGVLPFFVEKAGPVFARARVAKLVGADFTLVDVDPPVRESVADAAYADGLRLLFEGNRCDMVHVGPISEATPQLAHLRRALAGLGDVAQIARDEDAGSHTLFELPDGFDAYLAGLSKNQRSNYRRNVNKLSKAFDFRVDVVRDGPELEREYEAFVEMHQAQWQAVNKLGHYGDWPGSSEFTRDLIRALAPNGRVRLMRMLADEEIVSYYFSFELNGTYYWRLPARLCGEQWDQYALGRVGLLKMMEVAASEGATAIEAGTGRYGYKEQLNARTIGLR